MRSSLVCCRGERVEVGTGGSVCLVTSQRHKFLPTFLPTFSQLQSVTCKNFKLKPQPNPSSSFITVAFLGLDSSRGVTEA
jgi:hypothetical protein